MEINKKMEQYAELCLTIGANLQKGQPVFVNSNVETYEFTRILAKVAYEMGSPEVFINWNDSPIGRLKLENAPMEVLSTVPDWIVKKFDYYRNKDACFISISSSDPEAYKGVDTERLKVANIANSKALENHYKSVMNNENTWLVLSVPSYNWAKKVFPNSKDPVKELWEAIFEATGMKNDNPIESWKEKIHMSDEKIKMLNEMKFKSLHYKSDNGTDLEVGLPEGHIWSGFGSKNKNGIFFIPNIPTEEVFTLPHKDRVKGKVYGTKPLIYGGSIIDEFWLEFSEGKVVNYAAKQGEEVLKTLLGIDEGARMLGEVALVPHDSPISNMGILFYNTLFDENASCHFALGRAYPNCLIGGEKMSKEELVKNGANDSFTHDDFMVGSETLSIIGEKHDGTRVEIFKNGNWA